MNPLPCPSRRFLLVGGPLLLLGPTPATARAVFPAGSAIGLEPPPGFRPSLNFAGFEDPRTHATILLVERPPAALVEIALDLAPDRLLARGLKEEARLPAQVAGREGALLRLRQERPEPGATLWLLLFPATGFTGFVTVTLPGDPPSAPVRAAVERALTTVALREVDSSAKRAALPFSFEETPGLSVRSIVAGSAAVLGPRAAAEGDAALPWMTLAFSTELREVPADRRAAVSELAFRRAAHLRDLRLEAAGESRLAGGQVVVLRGTATEVRSGQTLRAQQWMIFFPDGGTLRALAEAPQGRFDAVLPEFERVVRSVRRR